MRAIAFRVPTTSPFRATTPVGIGLACLLALAGCASDDAVEHAAPGAASHDAAQDASHAAAAPAVAPFDALARLAAGNQRYVSGQMQRPDQTPARRVELATSQQPFAIILGCADSRTPPELLFDQGLGDLFVVRVAGNVLDDHALGSIEYAAEHLHAGLVIVLGHERCGAVKAARDVVASGNPLHDHIESIVKSITPAVLATKGQDAEATCRANVDDVVQQLRASEPVLHELESAGRLQVVGAYYNLDTGAVTFSSGH